MPGPRPRSAHNGPASRPAGGNTSTHSGLRSRRADSGGGLPDGDAGAHGGADEPEEKLHGAAALPSSSAQRGGGSGGGGSGGGTSATPGGGMHLAGVHVGGGVTGVLSQATSVLHKVATHVAGGGGDEAHAVNARARAQMDMLKQQVVDSAREAEALQCQVRARTCACACAFVGWVGGWVSGGEGDLGTEAGS